MAAMTSPDDLQRAFAYPGGTVILDNSFQIAYVTVEFCRMFGCQPQEMVGQMLENLFSPKDRRGTLNFHNKLSRYEKGFLDVVVILLLNEVEYITRLRLIRQQSLWVAIFEDILAENDDLFRQFHLGRERWTSIVRNSSEGIAMLDTMGCLVEFNSKFLELMQFRSPHGVLLNEDAILNKFLFELLPVEKFRAVEEAFIQAKTRKKLKFSQEIAHLNFILQLELTPIYLPVQGFSGCSLVVKDITAQHNLQLALAELHQKNQELQTAHQELRQRELKFRNIFENSQVGIFRTRMADGLILEANQRYTEMAGYESATQLVGQLFAADLYVNPNDRRELVSLLEDRKEVSNFEIQYRRRNGEIRWGMCSMRVHTDTSGSEPSPPYLDGVIVDITDRKQLEEQLRQSQQFLNSVIDNIPLSIYIKDVANDFRFVLWNRASEQMSGVPRQQAIGWNVYDMEIPREQADFFHSKDQEAVQTQQLIEIPEEICNTPGGPIFLRTLKVPLLDEQERVTHLLCISENITQRKQAELALRESEATQRAIINAIPDLLIRMTGQGSYRAFYTGSEIKVFRPELDYRYATVYESLPPEIANHRMAQAKVALETGELQVYEQELEINGELCQEEVRIVVCGEDEVLLMVRDISERKRAEAALRSEQEKSERLLLNILPQSIADRLKQSPQAIADGFEDASILFADIVGFTELSGTRSPHTLVELLNDIFSLFDQLSERYGLEKIKTIGDAYMVVGGLPNPHPDHLAAIAAMALDMQQAVSDFSLQAGQTISLRMGINVGPVVAGVIGHKKFIYDLWGDAVNVASRMESLGEPGRIQVTQAVYQRLQHRYQFAARGTIPVKGKGRMPTYWLLSHQEAV